MKLDNVQSSYKYSVIALLTSCLIIIFFMIWQYLSYSRIKILDITDLSPANANCSVDIIDYGDKYVAIFGWCMISGQDMRVANNRFVFRNTKTNEYYLIPSAAMVREDVTKAYNDGFNYDFSGLQCKAAIQKLDLEHNQYQVLFLCESNGETGIVDTDTIISMEGNN